MESINPGDSVVVMNAAGTELPKIALTGVTMGQDFPVVWACRAEEWEAAKEEGRAAEGIPWPAEDVRLGYVS